MSDPMTDWTDEPLPVAEAEPAPLFVETTPDGGQIRLYDYSGDQAADTLIEGYRDGSVVVVADTNGDRLADTFGLDVDGDGHPEMIVTREGSDYRVQVDTSGDGQPDGSMLVTRDELLAIDPTVVEALELRFDTEGSQNPGQFDVDPQPESPQAETPLPESPQPESPLVVDGQLVGDPVGDAEHWFEQAQNGFCVPASIAQIVSEYTGVHFADEMAFVERANELQILDIGPDGSPSMSSDGALTLLEDAGVPASLEVGTGVETLVEYLDEERRVVLFIDSGELWEGEPTEDSTPDHAVVVTGVDLERQVVIISDPGHPAGNAMEYPIGLFENAWEDAGFLALVCDVPPADVTGAAPQGTEIVAEPANEEPASSLPAAATPSELPADLMSETAPWDPTAEILRESGADSAIAWAVENRWAVLPVVMSAAYLLTRGSRAGR